MRISWLESVKVFLYYVESETSRKLNSIWKRNKNDRGKFKTKFSEPTHVSQGHSFYLMAFPRTFGASTSTSCAKVSNLHLERSCSE